MVAIGNAITPAILERCTIMLWATKNMMAYICHYVLSISIICLWLANAKLYATIILCRYWHKQVRNLIISTSDDILIPLNHQHHLCGDVFVLDDYIFSICNTWAILSLEAIQLSLSLSLSLPLNTVAIVLFVRYNPQPPTVTNIFVWKITLILVCRYRQTDRSTNWLCIIWLAMVR